MNWIKENGKIIINAKYYLGMTELVTICNGNVTSQIQHTPFGEDVLVQTGTSSGDNSEDFFFTGKEKDAMGLYYFGARYYDPEIGRFISEDPGKDGNDWFAFCGNNPIRYFDPDGQAKTEFKDFFSGLTDAVLTNFGGKSTGDVFGHPDTTWYYLGKVAGDAGSIIIGGVISEGGKRILVIGVASSEAAVGVPVAIAGAYVTAYGVKVSGNGLGNGLADGWQFASKLVNGRDPNYRANLVKKTGIDPSEAAAHHNMPVKFGNFFKNVKGLNYQNPKFGSWVEKYLHSSISREFNLEWEYFIRTHPNASASQVINFARSLAAKFGIPTNF